jgi:hypothetical protein
MTTATARPVSRQQKYRPSMDFGSVTSSITLPFDVCRTRSLRIDSVWLSLPAGLAADAANFCVFQLLKNQAVIASWSTRLGAIAARMPVYLGMTPTLSDRYLADGDTLSLSLGVTGTLTVPFGRIGAEGVEL